VKVAPERRGAVANHSAGAYDARAKSSGNGLAEGLDDGRIKRFLAQVWKKEKLRALKP
jgi:hypothetical protein